MQRGGNFGCCRTGGRRAPQLGIRGCRQQSGAQRQALAIALAEDRRLGRKGPSHLTKAYWLTIQWSEDQGWHRMCTQHGGVQRKTRCKECSPQNWCFNETHNKEPKLKDYCVVSCG